MKSLYPDITIFGKKSRVMGLGEEDANEYAHLVPTMQPDQVNSDFIKQGFLEERFLLRESILRNTYREPEELDLTNPLSFKPSEASVWVDPLDGTNEFLKGNICTVSTMIGIAIKGVAKIGVSLFF